MRNRLVTFLILLMVAFPVWSASTVCCHLQKASSIQSAAPHHCCDDMKMGKQHCHHAAGVDQTAKSGDCQCDQFQHSQFALSLPEIPLLQPVLHFDPEISIPTQLAERHETIIRPPIA